MKTYQIITLGCAMNHSDSERVAFFLEKHGFVKGADSDLSIVNMCSIRQSAVNRVLSLGQKLKGKKILTGCIVKEDISRFERIFDYILPIKSLDKWEEILKKEKYIGFKERRMKEDDDLNISYLSIPSKYNNTFSVNIPISYGCDNFCTYCVVPYTRGPLVCRKFDDIIKEAKQAVKNGAKEIWLLGQNVNDYTYSGKNFSNLIKEINDIPGEFWVRFTSPHPAQADKEFIEILAKSEKFTPYINFPVQSGDDDILKAMNRPYTSKQYLSKIKQIRNAFEKYRKDVVAISTDAIVGFPNETDKQFENTVKIFKEAEYMLGYISQYSARKGTPAAKNDNIQSKVKKERWVKLNNVLSKLVLKFNKQFVGKTLDVLVFNKKKNLYMGKTKHYATVMFESKENHIGKIIPVKITSAESWILKGKN